jgi:DNA polymerase-3 subunit delta'
MDAMNSHAPLGHAAVLEGLWHAARSERLPHALLMRGPEGIGKYHAARWLALGLLCQKGPGDPCLDCGACRRVLAHSHPDLFLVDSLDAGQERMTIQFIVTRENRPQSAYSGPSIEDFLRLRADEGGWRVVCLRDVDSMNESAQNAFLKTLEEPGEDTLLLLTTSRPDVLLETIRSRTVSVDLAPLSQADTLRVLERHAQVQGLEEARQREVLARWSLGAPGRALTLARRGGVIMRAMIVDLVAGHLGPDDAGQTFWELEGEFPGKSAPAQRRTRARALMDLALEWLMDGRRQAARVPLGDLAHGDVLAPLTSVSPGDLDSCVERVLQARQDASLNISPEILTERVLRALADLSTCSPAAARRP